MYQAGELWRFLPVGYGLTVLIETSVLLFALSIRHQLPVRLFCGAGLTAVTYPIVILVMPLVIAPYALYLAVAEVLRRWRSVCCFCSSSATPTTSNRIDETAWRSSRQTSHRF